MAPFREELDLPDGRVWMFRTAFDGAESDRLFAQDALPVDVLVSSVSMTAKSTSGLA